MAEKTVEVFIDYDTRVDIPPTTVKTDWGIPYKTNAIRPEDQSGYRVYVATYADVQGRQVAYDRIKKTMNLRNDGIVTIKMGKTVVPIGTWIER